MGTYIQDQSLTWAHTFRINPLHGHIHSGSIPYMGTYIQDQSFTWAHTFRINPLHGHIHSGSIPYMGTYIQDQSLTWAHTVYSGSFPDMGLVTFSINPYHGLLSSISIHTWYGRIDLGSIPYMGTYIQDQSLTWGS
jgi:hypothetical protein